jgi:hypothetical protein
MSYKGGELLFLWFTQEMRGKRRAMYTDIVELPSLASELSRSICVNVTEVGECTTADGFYF